MAKDELEDVAHPNPEAWWKMGMRLLKTLEGIEKHLGELNETLSSVVGEYAVDPSSPQKTATVMRTYDMKNR